MPWTCKACGVEQLDDVKECPQCASKKEAWTLGESTRAFVITSTKGELLVGDPASGGWVVARSAPLTSKAHAREVAARGEGLETDRVLKVRVTPRPRGKRQVELAVAFDQAEVEERAYSPQEDPGAPDGPFEVCFALVWGEGSSDLELPGVHVVDVSEDNEAGHAPEVEVTTGGRGATTLPLEQVSAGEVEITLVDADHTPLAGVSVTLQTPTGRQTVTSDPQGVVRAPDVEGLVLELSAFLGHLLEDGPDGTEDDHTNDEVDEEHEERVVPGRADRKVDMTPAKQAKQPKVILFKEASGGAAEEAKPAEKAKPAAEKPWGYDQLTTTWRHGKTKKLVDLTADELALKRGAYVEHCRWGASKRTFLNDVAGAKLSKIPGTSDQLVKDAASQMGKLLEAARADLAKATSDKAKATVSLGITSAYRSASVQLDLWNGRFYKYLWQYYKQQGLKKPTPKDVDAKGLASFIGGKTAAPGFSNHNAARAVDFEVRFTEGEGKKKKEKRLGAGNRSAWKKTWFYEWLKKRASEFDFKPYAAEPWHWDYKP